MVIRTLLVLFLIIGVSAIPVSADYNSSGTVDYSYSESLSYNFSGGLGPTTCDISTSIRHLFTDAKVLDTVIFKDMWSSTLSYTKNDVTPFVATVGGTYYGSGVASIVEQLDHSIFYTIDFSTVDVDFAQTLSGIHQVNLAFDDTITNGLAGRSIYYFNSDPYGLDVSHPTQLWFSAGGGIARVSSSSYNYVQTSYMIDYSNSYNYNLNSTYNISNLEINRSLSSSLWSVYDSEDTLYFEDESGYSSVLIDQDFLRYAGVYANTTYNTASGPVSIYTIIDFNGTAAEPDAPPDDDDFDYNITIELDEYSPGDTVNVTYTTDQKGTIQVVKTISGDIYHSIGFVSGATNATWQFYIAENEPYGFYDVFLLDSSNTILDSVRYSLLPTTSSLDILQSSVDLHETFVVFAQTVNESILSIEDPDGVEVWNESIGALMYDYVYYTPTIKTGIYTAYLYDDAALNDTVMVYLADPPIIDDPLDPETNGSIVVEDVLGDDETMTEYYNEKFRDFAPTIWGFFMLMCLLFLMSILTSFNSGGKR